MERIRLEGDFENQKEVMSAIGQAWRTLEPADKVAYQQRAEQAKSAISEAVPQGLLAPESPQSMLQLKNSDKSRTQG
jgi:hypothetical protein